MKHSDDFIEDGELERYLEGRADLYLQRKVENSPDLTRLVEDLDKLTNYLQTLLFRENCPEPSKLGDYYLGLLSKNELSLVEEHLHKCPMCAREVLIFQQELGDPLVPPGLFERLKLMAATLLDFKDPDFYGTQPRRAYRGEESTTRIFSTSNGVNVAINIHDDEINANFKVIRGLLGGMSDNDVTIYLWQNGSLIDITTKNEDGNFAFVRLAPGDYELVIKGKDTLIHIQQITIKS